MWRPAVVLTRQPPALRTFPDVGVHLPQLFFRSRAALRIRCRRRQLSSAAASSCHAALPRGARVTVRCRSIARVVLLLLLLMDVRSGGLTFVIRHHQFDDTAA